jgi:hypothetical protein
MSKTFKLNDTEYSVIMSALAMYADHHFEKSNKLKREADAQYHKEQFQKTMNVKFELREQKEGQD